MTWETSSRPGSTRSSRTMAARVLREEPTCRAEGCDKPSVEDDHIVPWSQREAQGLSISQWHARSNHQGLCTEHHQAKTHAESMAGRASTQRKRPTRRHPADT